MAGSRGSRPALTPHKERPIVGMDLQAAPTARRQQNGAMAADIAAPIEQRLAVMATDIRRLIPAAEVRLFGSRARGGARPDSDVDLLITAPDAWLAQRDRFSLLGELWGAVAQPDLSVDLVLHSSSEASSRVASGLAIEQHAMAEGLVHHRASLLGAAAGFTAGVQH